MPEQEIPTKKEFKNMFLHGAKVLYQKQNYADEFEPQN